MSSAHSPCAAAPSAKPGAPSAEPPFTRSASSPGSRRVRPPACRGSPALTESWARNGPNNGGRNDDDLHSVQRDDRTLAWRRALACASPSMGTCRSSPRRSARRRTAAGRDGVHPARNGDVMYDPEIVFEFHALGAEPISFRNDDVGAHHHGYDYGAGARASTQSAARSSSRSPASGSAISAPKASSARTRDVRLSGAVAAQRRAQLLPRLDGRLRARGFTGAGERSDRSTKSACPPTEHFPFSISSPPPRSPRPGPLHSVCTLALRGGAFGKARALRRASVHALCLVAWLRAGAASAVRPALPGSGQSWPEPA